MLPARDPSKGAFQKELNASLRNIVKFRQEALYFEEKKRQRYEHDQVAYQKAFDEDLPWPNPVEVAEYKQLKRLKQAPRSWDLRVPKLTRHLKQVPAEDKPAPKAPSGGH